MRRAEETPQWSLMSRLRAATGMAEAGNVGRHMQDEGPTDPMYPRSDQQSASYLEKPKAVMVQ